MTTTGNSGAATYSGGTLNIPQYQGAITLTTNYTSGFASLSGNTINVPHYQGALTLTTTGTSGAATLSGDTLNIPQYAGTTITDLGTLTYNAGGTTTFAAASAGIAAAKVTVTHSTATTFVPTGLVKWGSYQVEIIQDSTGGGVTFTLGSTGTCSVWKITGGGAGAITLSSSANAIDMLSFTFDGTNCIGSLSANAN